jgi:uncharacterized protein (TIGR02678 family)
VSGAGLSQEERRRAFAQILDHVAVTSASDPASFRRIRRLQTEMQAWFASRAGWPLVVSRDFARLVKTPALHNPGGDFRRAQSPLDYELIAWVLWYGERAAGGQFILSDLLAEVQAQANLSGGAGHVDWSIYAHRRAFHHAMTTLEEMGVIARNDGDLRGWLDSGGGDVLYEFTDLSLHLYVDLPDGIYDELVVSGDATGLAGPQARPAPPEQRLYRTLLLEPALYAMDDPEAYALATSRDRRETLEHDLAETFGWDLEVTDAYIAVLRPAETRAGRTFPAPSSIVHVALLFCGCVREQLEMGLVEADHHDRVHLSEARIEQILLGVREEHEGNWSVSFARRSLADLAAETIASMREWGFLEGPDGDGRYALLPLAARFRGIYTEDGEGLDKGGDE